MGKRQRRRNRQKKHTTTPRPAVQRYLLPNADSPLLEVVFHPDVTDDDKAICLDYWAFTEPGTWMRKVADIGPTAAVLRTVKASCHADLLTIVCPDCAGPRSVHSRSDVTATRLWAPDVFPLEETVAGGPCQACQDAAAAQAAQDAERARQEKQAEAEERVTSASTWMADHSKRDHPDGLPDAGGALALLTIIEIMERTDAEAFGPLTKLEYSLTESDSTDIEALRELYQDGWIAPTLPATTADFAFNDDNTVRGVYIGQVPWRLAHALGSDARKTRQRVSTWMRHVLLEDASLTRLLVTNLEANMAVDYLNGLLTRKYNEDPIPEHRLPDAFHTFITALNDGFTLGQLVAVAWSATASSVAWGQRTPGLKPGSVSAASVTNLGRRIGYAKDRPIPEYDLPNWVNRPATYATALRILEQQSSEAEALARFLSLRQRIASRDLDAFDFDSDMADHDPDEGLNVDDFIKELKSGTRRPSKEPPITYALVTPDGELGIHTAPPREMRDIVSMAGAGYVDRLILEEPSRVNAYIGEGVPASEATANPVASEMLRLLNCHDGPFNGPVCFFAIASHPGKPRSLDEEQQEMLRAAYEVAKTRSASA
ncbi:hypothetical protein OOK48_35415 [Streptomyces viridodiastaticus]|uniref:hypothetical protein n=1 Tax=Streptomyces albogriseolus TaxID=1887 RepID=UPI002250947C|nr:hypothetical protein [Streptomyces viridodiastaticus]MCX4571612.1 hypothetical protein [Streptomyces viridodiastaticus]